VFFGMIENVVKKHPHVKVVATTLREVHSTNRHSWSAVAWIDGKTYNAPTAELDVYDRVGGGDGFAAGFIYGLLTGEEPEEAVKLGWAHGALLTTFPGDTTMATLEQVRRSRRAGRQEFSVAKVTLVFALLLVVLGLAGFSGHRKRALYRFDSHMVWRGAGRLRLPRHQPQREPPQAVHAHQCDHRAAWISRCWRRRAIMAISASSARASPDMIALGSQAAMAVDAAFTWLCVRSFIAARRSGQV
jgi:hypothetical protein